MIKVGIKLPTILKINGYRFFFYSNEGNEPAHIHVIGNAGEMKIWLDPIEVSTVYKLNAKNQREVLKITKDNVRLFLDKWTEYYSGISSKK